MEGGVSWLRQAGAGVPVQGGDVMRVLLSAVIVAVLFASRGRRRHARRVRETGTFRSAIAWTRGPSPTSADREPVGYIVDLCRRWRGDEEPGSRT
jgi:hypothetical protein